MSIETTPSSASVPRSGRAPTVLCVDDEPMVLEGLFLHLRRHYKVLTERNPLNAVRLLREHPHAGMAVEVRSRSGQRIMARGEITGVGGQADPPDR